VVTARTLLRIQAKRRARETLPHHHQRRRLQPSTCETVAVWPEVHRSYARRAPSMACRACFVVKICILVASSLHHS